MKKNYAALLFSLFVSAYALAQFPAPYCAINDDWEDIEEITTLNFNGLSYTNTNISSIHVDLTALVVDVEPGGSYSLTLQGNTYGEYENEFVVFVDWNQNGMLDDDGEVYYIDLIFDSTGYDDVMAIGNIVVPANAAIGATRARIMKVWTDTADDYILNIDPCYISVMDIFGGASDVLGSYGQAIDVTVNVVGSASVNPLNKNKFTVYPNPANDVLNIAGEKAVNEVLVYNLQGQKVLELKGNAISEMNVTELASGQYMVKLNSDEFTQTIKFVKK
jgi:hypothetical protein